MKLEALPEDVRQRLEELSKQGLIEADSESEDSEEAQDNVSNEAIAGSAGPVAEEDESHHVVTKSNGDAEVSSPALQKFPQWIN